MRRLNTKAFLQSDWVIALFCLIVFLVTNGYNYAWDDQHLEIPMLKSLIDPSLYAGDYYVTTLTKNFPSFFYILLSRLISIDKIPATYLFLYLVTKYFFLFWTYKLWKLLSGGQKLTAFLCTLTIFLVSRVEEFIYRTFSHQEFAFAIILGGIYYFYKERFILSAMILGLAANIHALYGLFPMTYMMGYLAWHHKRHGGKTFFKAGGVFAACSLPFLLMTLRKHLLIDFHFDPAFLSGWRDLYLLACPQNFLFETHSLKSALTDASVFFEATEPYWFLLAVYFLNFLYNKNFRGDKKTQVALLMGLGYLIVSFFFTYLFPSRQVLDLNLVRNIQYAKFFIMGYATVLLMKTLSERRLFIAAFFAAAFAFLRFKYYIPVAAVGLMGLLLELDHRLDLPKTPKNKIIIGFLISAIIACAVFILKVFISHHFFKAAQLGLWVSLGLIAVNALLAGRIRSPARQLFIRKLCAIILFLIVSITFIQYHINHIRTSRTGQGFWQLQRNWIDMQHYVRTHTPKNAYLMVPYDMEMGGFRIFSERKIICSYRDCGLVGFDYTAAVEWQNRIKDIEPFKVFVTDPLLPAIMNAVIKYKVNYIVFMGYMNPGDSPFLKLLYKNEAFSLYEVTVNPVPPSTP